MKIVSFMNPLGGTVMLLPLVQQSSIKYLFILFTVNLKTGGNMIICTNRGNNGDIKLGPDWFSPYITQPLFINYTFGPTILIKSCLFRIINRLSFYYPINYNISHLMENSQMHSTDTLSLNLFIIWVELMINKVYLSVNIRTHLFLFSSQSPPNILYYH